MKHAKKLLCLALAMVMSLSLVACSSSGDGKADGSDAAIDHIQCNHSGIGEVSDFIFRKFFF